MGALMFGRLMLWACYGALIALCLRMDGPAASFVVVGFIAGAFFVGLACEGE